MIPRNIQFHNAYARVSLAIAACALPAHADDVASRRSFHTVAQTYVAQCVERTATPGAALFVFNSAGAHYFFTHGYENITAKRAFTPRTRTTIHSISKIFAGLIAMQLAEEGKIALDAPVAAYVPHIRFAGGRERKVTIRHLLTHTSGLPLENEDFASGAANAADAPNIRFLFEPGAPSKRSYSNTAFAILGEIFETVEGKALDAIVSARIVRPLGLADTRLGSDPFDDTLAKQYMPRRYDLPFNLETPLQPLLRPRFEHLAGGMTSSALDLMRLGRVLLNRGRVDDVTLLSPASYDAFATVSAPGASYDQAQGLRYVQLRNAKRVQGHSGSWAGGVTALYVSQELDLGIVAFANISNRCDADDLTFRLFEAAYAIREGRSVPGYDAGKRDVDAIRRIANAADYSGAWSSRSGRILSLAAERETLFVESNGKRIRLEHFFEHGRDAFVQSGADPGAYPYAFTRTKDGRVSGLNLGPEEFARKGDAFPPSAAAPAAWAGLAGTYRNDRAAPNAFEIYLRNGRLYRRAYWDREEELRPLPGSDDSNALSFALGAADLPAQIDFVLFNGRAIKAILDGAPFERSFLDGARRSADMAN